MSAFTYIMAMILSLGAFAAVMAAIEYYHTHDRRDAIVLGIAVGAIFFVVGAWMGVMAQ